MKKATLFLASFILAIACVKNASAQIASVTVPQNVDLKTKDDYAKYEQTIVDAAIWLEKEDLDQQIAKRNQVDSFVMAWVMGSPSISIDISEELTKIYGRNTLLLPIFTASYASYFIQHKGTATKFDATKYALSSIMNVYGKDINISKSKEMGFLIRDADNDRFDDFIRSKFRFDAVASNY